MANLLDLMTEEDRQRMLERYEQRMTPDPERGQHEVAPELYIVSELGYYYGWEAIMAVRNNEITLEEVYAYVEGAKKVYYSKLIEETHARIAAQQTAFSKYPQSTFDKTMKPFIERAS